jgi:CrcB protein
MDYFWVFIGGGLGSICRYGIARLLTLQGYIFPWATVAANALSCILLGCLVSLSLKNAIEQPYKIMLMTGFCGGFSTFSTFTNETYQLFLAGEHFYALINVLGSLIVCLFCIWLGIKLGESYF